MKTKNLILILLIILSFQASHASETMSSGQAYEILEIEQGADISTARKAYRKLALQWHPDKNPDNKKIAEEKFNQLSEALQIIQKNQLKTKRLIEQSALEKAISYYDKAKYDKAVNSLDKLEDKELDPDLKAQVFYYLALTYLKLNKKSQSYRYAQLALEAGKMEAQCILDKVSDIDMAHSSQAKPSKPKQYGQKRKRTTFITAEEATKRARQSATQ